MFFISGKCSLFLLFIQKMYIYIFTQMFFFSVVNVPCFYQLSTTGFCYLDIHHEEILTAGMSMSRLP